MTRLALALVTLLAAAPAAAQSAAQPTTFTAGEIALGDDALRVRFTADGPIGDARISSEPGAVRVRFAEATGDVRLDLPGDGDVLRFVRVRPGAEDATVAVLRFTDRRQLDPSSVLVRSSGNEVELSIDRSLLPASSVPAAPAPSLAAPEVPVAPEAPPVLDPELLALNASEPVRPRGALFAPTPAAPAPAPAEAAAAPLGVRGEETASGRTSLLVLLAVLAAAALGIVHWLRGRKSQVQARLPIAVVASHRISQRQQLVVVRALGQDHLLSIDGNRTERLCSQPSPGLQAAGLSAEHLASEPTEDFGAHLADMLGQLPAQAPVQRTGMATGPLTVRDPVPARDVTTLPGSLLNPAMAGYATPAASSFGPATSDAVAGLLRLRARTFR